MLPRARLTPELARPFIFHWVADVRMIPCLSMEVAIPDRGNAILANARLLYHCMHIHAKFRLVEERAMDPE